MNFKNNASLEEAETKYQEFLADLRGVVLNQWIHGRSWKEIAADAFVHPATVERFADGTTVRPTSFTVTQLVKVCDLRIALVPIGTPKLPGEIG